MSRVRLGAVVFGVVWVLLAVAGKRATACSCAAPSTINFPAPDTTNVAINTMVMLSASLSSFEIPLVEVRDELGELVAGTLTVYPDVILGESWLRFTPNAPLQPETTYRVELDGVQRSVFTTSDVGDESPPLFTGLATMTVELTPSSEDRLPACWSRADALDEIRLTRAEEAFDTPLILFELRRDDEQEPFFSSPALFDGLTSVFSGHDCEPAAPTLELGTTYCGRLIAYDGSGNTAGEQTEVCQTLETCVSPGTGRCAENRGCSTSNGHGSTVLLIAVLVCVLCTRRSKTRLARTVDSNDLFSPAGVG